MIINDGNSDFVNGLIKETSKTGVNSIENKLNKSYNQSIKIVDYVEYDETKGGTISVGINTKWN